VILEDRRDSRKGETIGCRDPLKSGWLRSRNRLFPGSGDRRCNEGRRLRPGDAGGDLLRALCQGGQAGKHRQAKSREDDS
jgi:hypothetical protein